MTSLLQRRRFKDWRILVPIIILSAFLNVYGNHWGAPKSWHPDEIIDRAISMVAAGTINPHYFAYGALHYYVLGIGAVMPVYGLSLLFDPPPPKSDASARERWWQPRIASMYVIARTISAVMSTAVVFFTWLIGRLLFDKRAGYLAAVLLSISMPFVAVAHFATVDSPANFWYWLSCLCGLLLWKKGDWRWYVLAAIAAGFSIGIKFDRLIVLFPLAISFYLRRQTIRFREFCGFTALIAAGYLAANLSIFTSFFEFADGFTRDLFYNALRGVGEGSSHTQVLHDLALGLGLPLFVVVGCGLAYAVSDLARGRNVAAIVWLFATILPYFFLFGSMGVQQWYLSFFFPALMILAAHACADLVIAVPKRYAYLGNSLVVGLALYCLLYTVAMNLQFSNDGRYLAARWINHNIPSNAKIELGERGPVVSKDKYQILYSTRDAGTMDYALENRKNLENHPVYSKVRGAILRVERWAGQTLGLEVRQTPYLAWFDREHDRQEAQPAPQSSFQADYVVLIEDLNSKKIEDLTARGSGYRLEARFQFQSPFGLRPTFPFVNPPVYIFRRSSSGT